MECSCCKKIYFKWPYEANRKRKGKYICTPCRRKNGVKISKTCPVCSKEFILTNILAQKQKTCSYACANKMFRSGENNGNWNPEAYRTTCFLHHKKECVICGEQNIVEVHHLDENKKNNSPENLIPLCPTHHQYWHSKYRYIIYDKVIEYINKFKSRCSSIG